MKCDLCGENVGCISEFDLSAMYWTQKETIQKISMNPDLKNYKIDLCGNCRKKIFDTSSIVIAFSLDLFQALQNKKIKVGFF